MLFVALLSVDAIYAQQVANYNRSRLPTHDSRLTISNAMHSGFCTEPYDMPQTLADYYGAHP